MRVERGADRPHLLGDAARLHVESLPGTLTSTRGVEVVTEIYQRMVLDGHSVYIAVGATPRHKPDVLGGLVVIRHDVRTPKTYAVIHRPSSWISTLRTLGFVEVLTQITDMVNLARHSRRLEPHDYVAALFVDINARRFGIAQKMLDYAGRDSVARGTGLVVDTLIGNDAAGRLYESFGFHERATTARSRLFTWKVA